MSSSTGRGSIRPRRSGGFALLTALVIIVLAAAFVLVAVAAVHHLQLIGGADAAGERARVLGEQALSAVSQTWRWRPDLASGSLESLETEPAGRWRATWEPGSSGAEGWPRVSLHVEATSGRARWSEDLVVELRGEPWAQGVTCAGDADVADELVVSGSGMYVGGCLRGRENVRFEAGAGTVTPGGEAADGVHGDVFPDAAAHGGVGVYAGGIEIHEGAETEVGYQRDTDRHVGTAVPQSWLESPAAEFLLAAADRATAADSWLEDGCLRLDMVSPAAGVGDGGRCLVLPAADDVAIEGSPPAAAGRLLVVVRGDATIGRPGETIELSGGLVVRGQLTVRGRLELKGSLHAGSLAVEAPTRVVVDPGWRGRPLAGAARPNVIERGG